MDDNPMESEVLKKLLKRRFDAEVFQAATMREADQIVAANNLDCIVLDLQLPDSGIDQTIAHIRNLPYPVFVYSGFDDPSLRERVLCSGAEDFILKATGNASIVERIGHLQYKRKPDRKLLEGAYAARHAETDRIARSEWRAKIPAFTTAIVCVCTFASGTLMGGWSKARDAGARAESDRQHFAKLDEAVLALQEANKNQDSLLRDLQDKDARSSTERVAIKDQVKISHDYIIDWLKRIDDKLSSPPHPQPQRHTGR